MSKSTVRRSLTNGVLLCGAGVSAVTTVWIVAGIVDQLRQRDMAPWILARASGFTSYVLIMLLVLLGLLLSHPAATRIKRPRPTTRLRIHVTLAVFTLAFTVLHVVVLATDPWAGVGWQGAWLPMAAEYRPVAVTMGVVAVWSGLITGLTASLAGRFTGRIWWPIHKVSASIFVLVWAHGFWAGTDTPVVGWFYVATGATVLALATSRYLAKTPADRVSELLNADRKAPMTAHRVAP